MVPASNQINVLAKSKFYGVYLLCSESSDGRYKGKCYIGFTVNPKRRIRQHNRGKEFGGARKTNNKGPWKMVMIIHGFPNNISALQFEWAWQQPATSSRLKAYPQLKRKLANENYFQYNIRILSRMLNVGPWERLPLIIHWLEMDYQCEFNLKPPKHMEITSKALLIEKPPKQLASHRSWGNIDECHICMLLITDLERSRIGCTNPKCKLTCHMVCLANHLLSFENNERGNYIPIAGQCPLCCTQLIWLDVLRNKFRIQTLTNIEIEVDDDDNDDNDDIDSDVDFDSDIEIIDDIIHEEAKLSPIYKETSVRAK